MSSTYQSAPTQPQAPAGIATASLVLGIVGFFVGICSIIGLIVGLVARGKAKRGEIPTARIKAGIVVSAVSLAIQVIGGIAFVALLAGGTAAVNTAVDEATSSATAESSAAAADVTVKGCETGQFNDVTAHLSITNSTDEPRSYLITVSANDESGARVAELNAAANAVGAGQTATVDALGSLTAGTVAQCVVVDASRY